MRVGPSTGVVVTGGWTWLQGTSGSITANSQLFDVQDACGASPAAFCTIKLAPTTLLSDLVFGFLTDASNNLTIASGFTCSSLISGKCTSGNAIDTCTLGSFHHLGTNDNHDACYVAGGAGGATFVTLDFSGTPSSTFVYVETEEILPPLCGGVRCTSSFDVAVFNFSNSSCIGGCTGSSMSITATDGIIGIYDSSGGTVNNFVTPYNDDYVGNMFAVDAISAPAYQVTGPSWYTLNQFAFKSQGGAFTPPSAPFAWANATTTDANIVLPNRTTSQPCNPSCSLTLGASTPTGHLAFLWAIGIGNAGVISAISNGGTWVIPTGANTCQQTGVTIAGLSCGFILATTSGATSLSLTMSTNGNYQFGYFDVSKSPGPITLDSQNSSFNSGGGSSVTGASVTITGPSVCFYNFAYSPASAANASINLSYYPLPWNSNNWMMDGIHGSMGMLLNVRSGTPAPTLYLQGAATTSASAGICFV